MSNAEPFEELGTLAAALCDGTLGPLDQGRLETLLAGSPEARRFFVRYLQLHGELCWEAGHGLGPAGDGGSACPVPLPAAGLPAAAPRWLRPWMVAASLLAVGLLGATLAWRIGTPASEKPHVPMAGGPGETKPEAPQSAPGSGSVAALRELVGRDPRLRHHYTFEGSGPQEQSRDKRGSLHLVPAVMQDGRVGGTVQFSAEGFDATTKALQPYRARSWGNSTGEALQSEADFHPPAEMTVELLLQYIDMGSDEENPLGAAVATRSGARQASFLVAAAVSGTLVQLFDAEAAWVEGEPEYAFPPGDWHYVAAVMQPDSNGTKINTYVANLSQGEKKLNHTVRNRVAPGTPAVSRLGIGKGFERSTAHAYPWSGSLDEVAIYAAALDEPTLQSHLEAIVRQDAGPPGGP